MNKTEITIHYQNGTLLVEAPRDTAIPLWHWCTFDERVLAWRCEGRAYADLVMYLYTNHIPYQDNARNFDRVEFRRRSERTPRPYQQEALNAWVASQRKGVVVLPTGAGKTFVAALALENTGRSTLVLVPTIDLMNQWADQLSAEFGLAVGILGGGCKEFRDITVATYDSALLTVDKCGPRFGLLVVDECHHLPGPCYSTIARASIAPFRLGLTATPERSDGRENDLNTLLGPICYRKDIDELQGNVLSAYETKVVYVDLEDDEYELYHKNRTIYTSFIRKYKVDFEHNGWNAFVQMTARQPDGREAMKAYLAQKNIAMSSRMKFKRLWELLTLHKGARTIIFTADNKMAYDIGEKFCLPVLTHLTKPAERRDYLDCFRRGVYPCLVTSKVLNEGVDVPEAEVGIVVSGGSSVREHVQRLGRILRPRAGKKAILYELVTIGTTEGNMSDRRRQHRAYERPGNLPN